MDEKPRKVQPKWMDPNRTKTNKANDTEKRIAKQLGVKRHAKSGGLKWSKWSKETQNADLKGKKWAYEVKRTDKKSISIKVDWLQEIEKGAQSTGTNPALVITFDALEKTHQADWVLIPLNVFQGLLKAAESST